MDTFLEKYNLPKLNDEEAESLNRLITTSGIKAITKKLTEHKIPGRNGLTEEIYKNLRKS